MPEIALVALIAGAAALATFLLFPFFAKRSTAQPLDFAVEDEDTLLRAVLSSPRLYRRFVILTPSSFACPKNKALWGDLASLAIDDSDPEHIAEAAKAGVAAKKLPVTSAEELAAVLSVPVGHLGDAPSPDISIDTVLAHGAAIHEAADSRFPDRYTEPTGDRSAPLRRSAPSYSYVHRSLLAVGVALAVAAVALTSPQDISAVTLTGVACLFTTLAGVFVIDVWTMFVDYWVLRIGAIAAGVLAVAGEWTASGSGRFLAATVVGVAFILALELVGAVFFKIRKVYGWGQGDSQVILCFSIVSVLVTGWVELPIWQFIAGLSVAALTEVTFRGRKTGSAFALVPYLAIGVPIGWVLGNVLLA